MAPAGLHHGPRASPAELRARGPDSGDSSDRRADVTPLEAAAHGPSFVGCVTPQLQSQSETSFAAPGHCKQRHDSLLQKQAQSREQWQQQADVPPTRQILPDAQAGIISKLLFLWAGPLMKQGNAKVLEEEDLWELPPSKHVATVTDAFEGSLDTELTAAAQGASSKLPLPQLFKTPLLRALWWVYWKEFLKVGVVRFFNTLIQFIPALLVRRLLRSIEAAAAGGGAASIQRAYTTAVALFAVVTTKTVFENQYFYRTTNLAIGVRAVISAMVYRKSLRLSPGARQNSTVGEIVNLMQLDAGRVETLVTCLHPLWDSLLQIVGYSVLLWNTLGPCAAAGFAVMASLIPINTQFFKRLSAYRQQMLLHTDQRVKGVNEMLQGIRAIKFYNWEGPFKNKIESIHNKELDILTRSVQLRSALVSVLSSTPAFVVVVTLGLYSFLGNTLAPSTVFTALALFNQLRFPLYFFPVTLSSLADGKVSVDRLTRFLSEEEVLPYVQRANKAPIAYPEDVAVSVKSGAFYWTDDEGQSGGAQGGKEAGGFVRPTITAALHGVDLCIKRGELVAVVGAVGSGKSSLVAALLGEMRHLSGQAYVRGNIAYVPQTAWIPNDTIRGNILFGRPYDEDKYIKVLKACSLHRDLTLLEAGDMTEIGEQGINLSGGQKQRLSLARALYADADTYFMDDPLSALDAQVGQRVFKDCIGAALRGRTRILVTNQLQYLPDVDRIIIMGQRSGADGQTILDQGTYRELIARGHDMSTLINSEAPRAINGTDVKDGAAAAGGTVGEGAAVSEGETANGAGTLSAGRAESPMSSAAAIDATAAAASGAHRQHTATAAPAAAAAAPAAAALHHRPQSMARQVSAVAGAAAPAEPAVQEEYGVFEAESRGMGAKLSSAAELSVASVHVKGGVGEGERAEGGGEGAGQKEEANCADIAAITRKAPDGKLMAKEERATGAVEFKVYKQYLASAASPALLGILVLLFATSNISVQVQQWVVSFWTSDPNYVRHSLKFYLGGVTASAMLVGALAHLRTLLAFAMGVRASRKLHGDMLDRVLHAPVSYFDTTPIGRLVQRFSKDTDEIDQQLISQIAMLINATLSMIGSVGAIVVATPVFALAILPLSSIYLAIMNFFRSPIYAHFGETLGGLTPIRAFGHMDRFMRANERRLDANLRAYLAKKRRLAANLRAYLAKKLGTKRAAGASKLGAGLAGLAITNALSVTGLLNWAVRCYTETETMMNSVQRVLYISQNTTQEASHVVERARPCVPLHHAHQITGVEGVDASKVVPCTTPLATTDQGPDDSLLLKTGWPWEGGLEFKGVTMRYREDTDLVLKGVDLTITPGEKIGIVGRTGSGKSSLLQVLFRMVEVEDGLVLIDGVDTRQMGLSALRSRLTIIPQEPVLFSGTLRSNLDPFDAYSEEEVWAALRAAGLDTLVRGLPEGLNEPVAEYGENLSVGQRQLLCMARALLRRSRLLLLDEATSSVDPQTDALIQKTIRSAFKDCTVLTIAHRLNTITDSDRILVMDDGRVAEFAPPAELLKNADGHFTKLLAAEMRLADSQDAATAAIRDEVAAEAAADLKANGGVLDAVLSEDDPAANGADGSKTSANGSLWSDAASSKDTDAETVFDEAVVPPHAEESSCSGGQEDDDDDWEAYVDEICRKDCLVEDLEAASAGAVGKPTQAAPIGDSRDTSRRRQQASARVLAQLRSQRASGAMAWMSVPPTANDRPGAAPMSSMAAATMILIAIFIDGWGIQGEKLDDKLAYPEESAFLSGPFAPVKESAQAVLCEVEGTIPNDIRGESLKPSRALYLDVHAVEERTGRPQYLKMGDMKDKLAGLRILSNALKVNLGSVKLGLVAHAPGTGNTALQFHAGRLLALHEADTPYALRVLCDGVIETIGSVTYDGKLKTPFTAHPKVDPATSIMYAFGYQVNALPRVTFHVINPEGKLLRSVAITGIKEPIMMHDFAITKSYAVFMDFPFKFDGSVMSKGELPFCLDKTLPARLGLLRLDATDDSEMLWFTLPETVACFHTLNAWEVPDGKGEGSVAQVELVISEYTNLSLQTLIGDDSGSQKGRAMRYTLDLAAKTVNKCAVVAELDTSVDFPQLYWAQFEPKTLMPVGLIKMDLEATSPESANLGSVMFGEEDDGYLLVFVVDTNSDNASEMHIYNAKTMNATPVATIKIPTRVPLGFHALHVTEQEIKSQHA
ncbi:hypothetical protein JKP88DRAFT_349004 [Tribonema minus]|uniref:Uncharacterized protein n=1 Tax=Tribonema minus TaxID=303371 RepID=A0A835YZ25_9STRA|nr:hypothetical protein JKP88DRAFT_349004 [Tribonema minus]